MSKRVVLRLEGDIQSGFRVLLEVGQQGQQPDVETRGGLPGLPDLHHTLNQWKESYRNLDITTRLKPKSINRYTHDDLLPTTQVQSTNECRSSSKSIQQALVNWLESPQFREIDKLLREELDRDDAIDIVVRSDDADLVRLPWHLWDFVKRYPRAEVSFGPLTSRKVNRYRQPKHRVRILAILGNSAGIDVQRDRQILKDLPNVDIEFLVEPKRHEITDQLWDQDWDILFFAGHSETVGSKGIIHINRTDSLSLDELKFGLQQAIEKGLQLAIFNSCDGLGLAHELGQMHIPQMIVMREPVPDYVAQEFLKNFLDFYARQGQPFHVAERHARERLESLEAGFPCATWLPVILQNPAEVPPTWAELQGGQRQTRSPYVRKSGSKKTPAPNLDENKVAPIQRSPGTQDDKAIVIDAPIVPGYIGRAMYQGTQWKACFRYPERASTVEVGQEVEAIAIFGNTLLIMPERDNEEPKGVWNSLRSFFK